MLPSASYTSAAAVHMLLPQGKERNPQPDASAASMCPYPLVLPVGSAAPALQIPSDSAHAAAEDAVAHNTAVLCETVYMSSYIAA